MSDTPASRAASFSRSLPVAVRGDCSIAVPGVLGVLAEVPKDAKAPEPRLKAEEAPVVGEATLVVVKGAMPLSGGLPPGVLSPPNRLVAEKVRDPSSRLFSLLLLEVGKEVLLELGVPSVSEGGVGTALAVTDLERRCQRLSMGLSIHLIASYQSD